MKETEIFPCDACGEPIPIGEEIQFTVDGEPCLRHAECQFEQCSGCEELISPGEVCYHDRGAGEVGVFCPKCDEFEDERCPQIGPAEDESQQSRSSSLTSSLRGSGRLWCPVESEDS